MAKEYAKAFYRSKAWIKCRNSYIQLVGGLCERCSSKGKIVPGYIVHHKKHLSPNNINDPNVTLNYDNLEYLCLDCHNEHHKWGSDKDNSVTVKGLKFNEKGELVQG